MKSIPLFLQIFLNFLQFSICMPSPYNWDPINLANNVHIFAEFMDEIYKNYRDEQDEMDTILIDPPKPYPQNNYSEKQKRTVFNFTFVKCASEIAHFRVISKNENSKDAYENLKMVPRFSAERVKHEFVGFMHFDQSLGHKIVEKFKNEFFKPKKEIDKSVVNQIMELAFSFAVRISLCTIYGQSENNRWYEVFFTRYHDIGGWQLKTLIYAYKSLAGKSAGQNENGVFPFQIIQIDKNGNHFWAQFLCPKQNLLQEILRQQQQYIRNFNFILELSDKKMTFGEIEKVIETIMSNKKKSPPAIYKFIEEKFTSFLSLPASSL